MAERKWSTVDEKENEIGRKWSGVDEKCYYDIGRKLVPPTVPGKQSNTLLFTLDIEEGFATTRVI